MGIAMPETTFSRDNIALTSVPHHGDVRGERAAQVGAEEIEHALNSADMILYRALQLILQAQGDAKARLRRITNHESQPRTHAEPAAKVA